MALTKPGRHADGGGLYLSISRDGFGRSWVYLYRWQGRTREMGLGKCFAVTLADAREARDRWRKVLQSGQDPLAVRHVAPRSIPTFGECADRVLKTMLAKSHNARHRDQWRESLQEIAAPLRRLPVDTVDTKAIVAALKPIWGTKPETANRARGRIEAVLNYASAHEFRTGDNPARWSGHLKFLLPARPRAERGHHAAIGYHRMADLMTRLRTLQGGSSAANCLAFIILTAARTNEAVGTKWSEIDLAEKVWTVPASRMKSKRTHRVPLSSQACSLLEGLEIDPDPKAYVFPGQIKNAPLSPGACAAVLKNLEPTGTVQGMRSAFRDYAGNETHAPREIAEAALAHSIGDQSEQAYRRGDALERRRSLMQAWADFCELRPSTNNVFNLVR